MNTVLKNRTLLSKYRDLEYSEAAPFYLYGSSKEMHIDHMLLRAPNAQLSAENVQWGAASDQPAGPNLSVSAAMGSFGASLSIGSGGGAKGPSDADLGKGLIAVATNVYERAMQPFPTNDEIRASTCFFFRPGAKLEVAVYRDPDPATATGPGLAQLERLGKPLATGSITLGEGLLVDTDGPNRDPFPRFEAYSEWKKEFDQIGKAMNP